MALTLHRLGLPRVIAMRALVSDRYATELAAELYRQLSVPAFPRAGVGDGDADGHRRRAPDRQ